jgi:hypothetical protein
MIERFFLEESECVELRRRVSLLQEKWTKRSDFGFFTLGTAAYLDATKSVQDYFQIAKHTNAMLLEEFSDLYAGLEQFLADTLQESVAFSDSLAMPGFHIFQFGGVEIPCDNLPQRAHFDLQFQSIIPDGECQETLSFTVLIEHPLGGASLAVWPIRLQDAVTDCLDIHDYAARNQYENYAYRKGHMLIHDGLSLHAIGSPGAMAPLGTRITIQGHGIRQDGQWLLYW